MTLAARIEILLKTNPGLTDREITDILIRPGAGQQHVNQVARRLAAKRIIVRRARADGLQGNYLSPMGSVGASAGVPAAVPVTIHEDADPLVVEDESSPAPRVLIITSCTVGKERSATIPAVTDSAAKYLSPINALLLASIRVKVLSVPNVHHEAPPDLITALDMYALSRRTKLYADIRKSGLASGLTAALAAGKSAFPTHWFVLSGGYGVLHALEPARPYNATFSHYRAAACGVCGEGHPPYCSMKDWRKGLRPILADILASVNPTHVFIFGDDTYLSLTARLTHPNLKRINSGRTPGAPGRLLKLTEMVIGMRPFDFVAV